MEDHDKQKYATDEIAHYRVSIDKMNIYPNTLAFFGVAYNIS